MFPCATNKLEHTKRVIEAIDADLRQSSFRNVNLSDALLDDVNLTRVSIHNANMSHLTIRDACLQGMSIADCSTAGATINGILVDDLLAAYNAAKS
ncbi:uncharacterized protein YjbI with pentapeptide repeats [Granulicella aggregans]|uniref:Uncharacterized protein YjbI with pentapeptide repeats n=1 Tax=Granulicella aggregans TaxID=474949 RepID=A0A7W8E3H7_9BACT|nr:pentapeptide repeat-containing protein [Granulicella aggregans]MBB5057993.1 uncharacterized protein YjbI with pentapeptide repeats [Granulicella aggregans]